MLQASVRRLTQPTADTSRGMLITIYIIDFRNHGWGYRSPHEDGDEPYPPLYLLCPVHKVNNFFSSRFFETFFIALSRCCVPIPEISWPVSA